MTIDTERRPHPEIATCVEDSRIRLKNRSRTAEPGRLSEAPTPPVGRLIRRGRAELEWVPDNPKEAEKGAGQASLDLSGSGPGVGGELVTQLVTNAYLLVTDTLTQQQRAELGREVS